MYFQITNRCNFSCSHCGMNATAKGEDMSIDTFHKALEFNSNIDSSITLGGGEPTIHPLFWQFLGESIAISENVWLATNGSQTSIAIALAKLAKKGIIGCALSQDYYHEPIDSKVVKAFTKDSGYIQDRNSDCDFREIRCVNNSLVKSGRCKDGEKGCICEDIFIKPNGDIFSCGCKKAAMLGNVCLDFAEIIPEDWQWGECSAKQLPKVKEFLNNIKQKQKATKTTSKKLVEL